MTALISQVFALTARDSESALWGPFYAIATATDAATIVTATPELPPIDRLFVVTGVVIVATPGAAQVALDASLFIRAKDAPSDISIIAAGDFRRPAPAAGAGVVFSQRTEAIVAPLNHDLVAGASFDAAVAANDITAAIHGYVVPRGNVALF